MRVDRDILPGLAGLRERLGQTGGKSVHRPTQSKHTAHAIDVGIEIEIVLVESYSARHVQDVSQARAVISTAAQLGRVFGYRIIQRPDGALVDQYPHERREKTFRNGPGNPLVFRLSPKVIAFVNDLPFVQHEQRCHGPVPDPGCRLGWKLYLWTFWKV